MADSGDFVISRKKPTVITTGPEWIGILVVIVLTVVAILVIYLYLKPKLFRSSGYQTATPPNFKVTCPTSQPPVGLTAIIGDHATPSFDASWTPVLVPTTSGSVILGYNVYVSTSPNVTKDNTGMAGYTPIPQVRVKTTSNGAIAYGKTYYFRVSTVDTCGEGALSGQEFSITV